MRCAIWDAAVESAHNGPRVLHVRMHGIITNKQGQRIADIEHTPDTVTETHDARNLALACNEARHAVRMWLPKTIPLRRGELWSSEEDVVTFVCENRDRLGLISNGCSFSNLTLVRLGGRSQQGQDLQIGRVGIDMTPLGWIQRQGQVFRDDDDDDDGELAEVARSTHWSREGFLQDTRTLFYLLQWSFPGSGVYAVWNNKVVAGCFTNARARVEMTMSLRRVVGAFPGYFARARASYHRHRSFSRFADMISGPAAVLVNLKVGNVIYSNNSNGTGSGSRIMELDAPEALAP